MATSNQKPVKTVTINYVDPAPGQSTQLEIINDPGGNVGEVQFKTTGGIFGGSNAFVWNNTTSNLGVRGNLSVTGNIYGNISASSTNLKIKGGVSGDVLITDGTGNLTWTSLQDAGGYGNNEVANYLPTFEGELSAGNADLGNAVTANFFIGNGSLLTGLPAGYANSNVANYLPTYTGNLTAGNANLGNSVTANYFTGNLYGTANLATFATTANGVALANVSGIGNIANINLTGSNSNVLYSNGVFAPVGSANTGNWGFRNDTIYNMAGGEINNGDPTHGATSGLILPENGNAGLGASLFNTYGNIQINVANLANSANTKVWEFGEDGKLTVPGVITKANTVQLTSSGATNAAAVIASGDHGRVTLRTDDGTTNKDWYFNVDGTTTFPDNTLKAINGANAVSPGTVGTAGATLTISAGTGGIAATSVNAGNGGDLTINAGDAGSDIGNPSWGAIGGTLVLRGGNSTRPYAGSNVEIRSGNSASIPGAISLHTGTNQWTFDATGNLTVPGSLINDTSIVLSAPAVFNICTIATAGSGYNTGSALKATTGGSGTGMTVGIGYGLSNQLSSVTVVDPGTGYVNGDVITVSEGTGGTFVITKYNQLANQTNNNTVQTDLTFANNTLTLPTYGEIIAPGNITANNIGNITPINLDGSSSNVLYGNGVFAPASGGANTGNVTFNNINIIGTGNLNLQPDSATSESLDIYLTAADDIHIAGSGNVILGTDEQANVAVLLNGNVAIQAGNVSGKQTWNFGTDGNLTMPGNLVIAGNTSVFGTDAALIQSTDDLRLLTLSSGANGSVSSVWVEDIGNVGTSNIAAVYANPTSGSKIVRIVVGQNGVGSGPNLWDFDAAGNLTLPGNTFAVNYANGTQVSIGGGGAVISNGTSNVSVVTADGNVVIGVDNDNMTWTFATDRKIYGMLDEDVELVAVDDGAGVGVRQVIVDDTLNELSRTRLEESDYYIQFDLNGSANSWRFDSESLRPPDGGAFEQFDGNIRMYAMNAGSNPVASLQSVSNQNDPNIFTTIDATTTGANIRVYNGGSNGGIEHTWQFDNDGKITLPHGGTLYSEPAPISGNAIVINPHGNGTSTTHQKLIVYPVGAGDHIHMATGNLYQTELFLGTDDFYVRLANTGDVVINTNSGVNSATWTFGTDGALTLPGGSTIDQTANVSTNINVNGKTWSFGVDGNLTLPGNLVGSGASPAPSINGFSSANFAGNVTADNILLTDGLIRSGVNTVITDGINSIALGLGATMDVYGFPFTQPTRGQLTISGITSTTQANGTWYYESINNNDYKLYTDNTYTTLVDSTSWTPYTGGGSVAITKSTTPINIVLDTNGFLTTFTNDGNIVLPGSLTVAGDVTANNLGNIVSTNLDGNVSNVLAGNGTWIAAGGGSSVAEASFSIQSSNFNAAEGSRYGVNTSAGAVTATLPASPTTGAAIFFADAGGAYATHNLTINPNGGNIMGSSSNITVSTNNQSVGLFYNGTTWRTYNAG